MIHWDTQIETAPVAYWFLNYRGLMVSLTFDIGKMYVWSRLRSGSRLLIVKVSGIFTAWPTAFSAKVVTPLKLQLQYYSGAGIP